MTSKPLLYTIGFTQKSAEQFFGLLAKNRVAKLVDTRLHNTGQLAGFAKRDDLRYFSRTVLGIEYFHWEDSAPEKAMLSAYKGKQLSWDDYAREYESLLQRRHVEKHASVLLGEAACLLCSEAKPHRCHRRLLADYLGRTSGSDFVVSHIL